MAISTALPRRRNYSAWIVIVAIVLMYGAVMAALSWKTHWEIDVHSGRTREIVELGPWQYSSVENDTDLSRLARQSGIAIRAPDWRRFQTQVGSARIHYRYGGFASEALRLPEYLNTFGVSEPDQQRLALTAIRCLEQECRFHVQVDEKLQTLGLYSDSNEIANAPMHTP